MRQAVGSGDPRNLPSRRLTPQLLRPNLLDQSRATTCRQEVSPRKRVL
jgi:hypothetical protein